VAIHPSGFFAVIAHRERVSTYTIHPDDLAYARNDYIEIRGTTEIQFSNGGHLFALNDDDCGVQVFQFWQHRRIKNGLFKEHSSKVKQILWLSDDTGFITVGNNDH